MTSGAVLTDALAAVGASRKQTATRQENSDFSFMKAFLEKCRAVIGAGNKAGRPVGLAAARLADGDLVRAAARLNLPGPAAAPGADGIDDVELLVNDLFGTVGRAGESGGIDE